MISSPMVAIFLSACERLVPRMDDPAHRKREFLKPYARLFGRRALRALLFWLSQPGHDVSRLERAVVLRALNIRDRAGDDGRAPVLAMLSLDVKLLERRELAQAEPANLVIRQAEMESAVRPEFQAAAVVFAAGSSFGSADFVSVTSPARNASV
jgi:hypothetical protein